MINDIENKNSQKLMSDLEYAKNDTEMMRYRVNGLSYKLGLSANLIKRCDQQMGITLSISQTLKNHLVEKYCDVKMGATYRSG